MNKAIAIAMSAGIAIAQSQNTPVRVELQKQSDYAQAAAALKRGPRFKKLPVPMITGEISAPVPGDRDIMLPESAIQAIRLESGWHNSAEPMLGTDGAIVYIYGQGQPAVPCAVDRICTIKLAAGETIGDKDADIGDSTHWALAHHQLLQQGRVQTYVTAKPQFIGLDTHW